MSSSDDSDDVTFDLACPYCLRPSTQDNMVLCTLCKNLIHFACADISESVYFNDWKDWRCKYCRVDIPQTPAGPRRSQRLAGKVNPETVTDTPAPQRNKNPSNLFNRMVNGAPDDSQVVTKEPPKLVPPVPAPRSVHSQALSSSSKRGKIRSEIEEVEMSLKLIEREKVLLEKRKKLLEELELFDYQSVVDDNQVPVIQHSSTVQQSHPVPQLQKVQHSSIVQQQQVVQQQQTVQQSYFVPPLQENVEQLTSVQQQPVVQAAYFDQEPSYVEQWLNSQQRQSEQSVSHLSNNLSLLTSLPNFLNPTPAQLTARHSMGQSLEKFSGKPGQWLIWATNFLESTLVCGFSYNENLIRLNKCLEGEARRMVEVLLIKSENIPMILKTLKDLYGRPDVLIDDMSRRIRSYFLPKSGGLNSVVYFACEIRNLSVMFENHDLKDYKKDPTLLNEIISKLPENVKYRWSDYSAQHLDKCHDIVFFADWFYREAMNLRKTMSSNCLSFEEHQVKVNRGR